MREDQQNEDEEQNIKRTVELTTMGGVEQEGEQRETVSEQVERLVFDLTASMVSCSNDLVCSEQ